MTLQIDGWRDFKAVTEFCRNRFYREKHREGFTTLTVMSGDYFYESEFDLNSAESRKAYQECMDWCSENAIPVLGSRAKELVFA